MQNMKQLKQEEREETAEQVIRESMQDYYHGIINVYACKIC